MASKTKKELQRAISSKLIKIKGSGLRDHQIRNLHEKPCRLMASEAKKLVWAISTKLIIIEGSGLRDHQIRNLHEKNMPIDRIKSQKEATPADSGKIRQNERFWASGPSDSESPHETMLYERNKIENKSEEEN